jgi:hypothetical protein
MGEERKVYKVFVGRSEVKRQIETPKGRWEDRIRMDLREFALAGGRVDPVDRIVARGGIL